MLKKIKEEAWSFTLYEDGNQKFLSVLCGTSAMYETVIELNKEEVTEVLMGNVKELSAKIREKKTLYKNRKILDFKHPQS